MKPLNNIITDRLNSKAKIKRIAGVVTEVIENTDNGKVKVKFLNSNNEESVMTLINKSHDELNEGDHIWIHYWNTVSDGYVAIKIGLSKFDATEYYPIPLNTESIVTDAYLFDKKHNTHNVAYSFTVSTSQQPVSISYPTVGTVETIIYTDGTDTETFYQTSFTLTNGQGIKFISSMPQWSFTPIGSSIVTYDDLTVSALVNGVIKAITFKIERSGQQIQFVKYEDGVRNVLAVLETITGSDPVRTYGFAFHNGGTLEYDPNVPAMIGGVSVRPCYYSNGWVEYGWSDTCLIALVLNNLTIVSSSPVTTVVKQTANS